MTTTPLATPTTGSPRASVTAVDPRPPAQETVPGGRRGALFAGVWLVFLLDPLAAAWAERGTVRGVVGLVATLVFGATHLQLWSHHRSERVRTAGLPARGTVLPLLAVLVGLGAVMVATLGEVGLAATVYVGVAVVMLFPLPVAVAVVLAMTAAVVGLGAVEGWGSQAGTAFGVLASAVAVHGMRTVLARNADLVTAHERNAALAVENERTRFARDLHDILGHSLTVITVKAELAGRLLDAAAPPDEPGERGEPGERAEHLRRARAEVADLERLSRDALADVRRAVEGYRELTLPGELARARTALVSAGIEADLPGSAEEVASDLRELFAWTIREGVTNVLRHSGARRCEVRLDATAVEVRDDGAGPSGASGSGLAGLRERAADVGAAVVVENLRPGFGLRVARTPAARGAGAAS